MLKRLSSMLVRFVEIINLIVNSTVTSENILIITFTSLFPSDHSHFCWVRTLDITLMGCWSIQMRMCSVPGFFFYTINRDLGFIGFYIVGNVRLSSLKHHW